MKKILIAAGSVLGFVLFVGWCANGRDDLLKASAGRGALSIAVTNQESSPLRDCNLRITDSAGVDWIASVDRDIPLSGSVTVAWSSFLSNGQPMPGHIGRDRGVVLTCDVQGTGQRKSVGFGT